MSLKYYQLAKDEEPPEEFCVVRDVGGEPSEYTFYVPESKVAKLRELVRDFYPFASSRAAKPWLAVRRDRMRELGVDA